MKNASNVTASAQKKAEPVKVAVNASNSTKPQEDNNSGNTTETIKAIFNITKESSNQSLGLKTAVKSEAKATKVNATAPPSNATNVA